MARMMGSNNPYRVLLRYEVPDSNGIMQGRTEIYGPYDSKSTAKSQGKRQLNLGKRYYKAHANVHYVLEVCTGWQEEEVHYV